jgi:hypothetical protein
MFIMVPMWGFAKSQKLFHPAIQMLERLPYVTWLIEWISAWFAGETDASVIPKSVRIFATGDPVTTESFNHTMPALFRPEGCDRSDCGGKKCDDGECYCKCHIKAEHEDACAEIGEGIEESPAGLGHPSRCAYDKKRRRLQHSVRESTESRVERLEFMKNCPESDDEDDGGEWSECVRNAHSSSPPVEYTCETPQVWRKKVPLAPAGGHRSDLCEACALGMCGQSRMDAGKSIAFVQEKEKEHEMKPEGWMSDMPFDFSVGAMLEALGDKVHAPHVGAWCKKHKTTIAGVFAVSLVVCGALVMAFKGLPVPEVFVPEGKKQSTKFKPRKVRVGNRRRRMEHEMSGDAERDLDDVASRLEEADLLAEDLRTTRRGVKFVDEGLQVDPHVVALQDIYFPVQVKTATVAKRRRVIQQAKATPPKSYTTKDVQKVRAVAKELSMRPESMLGKVKLDWLKISHNVFKVEQDGEFTSSSTVVGDKIVVPLHSEVEGAEVRIVNHSASAKISSELIPITKELGIYCHGGVVKPMRWNLREPKNEQVVLLGYTSPDQVEPRISTGFCSTEGLANYPSDHGDCGGAVISCEDGALIGFHIGGGQHVNRFVPVTAQMVAAFKATLPVLSSMVFP